MFAFPTVPSPFCALPTPRETERVLASDSRDPSSPLSERDAAALWRRAAELQADEAVRQEERSRDRALQRALAGDEVGEGSFSLSEVEAAAADAGIPVEYVQLAWLERRHDKWAGRAVSPGSERARMRVLGTDAQNLEVSRRYEVPPERILEAMSRVFPNTPFNLQLEAHEQAADGEDRSSCSRSRR